MVSYSLHFNSSLVNHRLVIQQRRVEADSCCRGVGSSGRPKATVHPLSAGYRGVAEPQQKPESRPQMGTDSDGVQNSPYHGDLSGHLG